VPSDRQRPWTPAHGGVTLSVRLTPKGGRDAVDGVVQLADGRCVLKVRVAAAPSDGEANTALLRLIAKVLGIPLRDVALTAGAASRVKQLAVSGHGPTLIAALEKIAAKG